MDMVTSRKARFAITICLLASAAGWGRGVHAQSGDGLDTSPSQTLHRQPEKYWIVLPERFDPPDTLLSKYQFLGYALYEPTLIRNDVCITRMVRIGFPSEQDVAPDTTYFVEVPDTSYFVAFRKAGSQRDCRELDFQREYLQISQPIDTDTLLELHRLVLTVQSDERAKVISQSRGSGSLRISHISVIYARKFGDLTYRLSVRDDDGPLMSITFGASSGTLQLLDISSLME